MKIHYQKILSIIFFVFIPLSLLGQEIVSQDTTSKQVEELHMVASFVKSFDHGLKLTLEEEMRINIAPDNPFHRLHTTVSLAYTPIEYLSMSAGYVLKLYGNQGWNDVNKYLRHRVNIDATGQVSLGSWKLSLRERLMMDARADEIDSREKNALDLVLRSRLQAVYNIPPIKKMSMSIVAKMEIFNTLNAIEDVYFESLEGTMQSMDPIHVGGQYINELRPEIGLQWKFNKKHTVNLAYRYNYVYSRDIHVLDDGNVHLTHAYTHKHVMLLTYKLDW